MKTIEELIKAASSSKLPLFTSNTSGRGIMSFGLVYSEANGKRFTMTKSLVTAIGVDEYVELFPIKEEGTLLVAKKLPFENKIRKKIRSKGDSKLSYAASVVSFFIEYFGLNFGKHVSMTFQDITIEKLPDGSPVAIINMLNPKPYSDLDFQNDTDSDEETGS